MKLEIRIKANCNDNIVVVLENLIKELPFKSYDFYMVHYTKGYQYYIVNIDEPTHDIIEYNMNLLKGGHLWVYEITEEKKLKLL